ncbi:MAG: 8-oxoguanine DNA glycosylase [Bacillota bacterium]|nr:8-oxoguanine DNA glycosylase [Bacillota bacterium]
MDFSYAESFENGIIVKDVRNFDLYQVFSCGQCFRWNREENGNYVGVALGRVIEAEKKGNDLYLYNTNKSDFIDIWADYFDLYRDYGEIKDNLKKDEILKKAVKYGEGIRILNQEPFEMLISFIISSNNRIPMIKKVIENICESFGRKISYKGKIYYTFPTLSEISSAEEEDFRSFKAGFRAKYIKNTIDMLKNGRQDLDMIKKLSSCEALSHMLSFPGVGLKVADCIMLFSMKKTDSFPVDIWVKRAMNYFYKTGDVSLKKIREYAGDKFGSLAGFAQQYLFFYMRENNIKI